MTNDQAQLALATRDDVWVRLSAGIYAHPKLPAPESISVMPNTCTGTVHVNHLDKLHRWAAWLGCGPLDVHVTMVSGVMCRITDAATEWRGRHLSVRLTEHFKPSTLDTIPAGRGYEVGPPQADEVASEAGPSGPEPAMARVA